MISKLLDRLERRYGRHAGIPNLMACICAAMLALCIADMVLGPTLHIYLQPWLSFDRGLILQGQVWRVVTFILLPEGGNLLFTFISLLFYTFLGNLLQSHWGVLRFNVFYLTGMVGSIIAGFITGYTTNYYLNMSLFLAAALLFPNMQINLYGILPVRMKWLALIDVAMILLPLLTIRMQPQQVLQHFLVIAVSLLNILLFFFDRTFKSFQDAKRRREWKKAWKR